MLMTRIIPDQSLDWAVGYLLYLVHGGHLGGNFHTFACLEKKPNAQMVFDLTYPVIDKSDLPDLDGNVA